MKISTSSVPARTGHPTGRRVVMVDERPTRFYVERGDPPRWGEPQEWWLMLDRGGDEADALFSRPGMTPLLRVLETIWAERPDQ